MPSSARHRRVSETKAPALGSWVTIRESGCRGSKARRENATSTPALVTGIEQGTATVVYPNNLVLFHGFSGRRVKRIEGVAFEHLAPWTGSADVVQRALLDALKSEVQDQVLSSGVESRRSFMAEAADTDTELTTADRSVSEPELNLGTKSLQSAPPLCPLPQPLQSVQLPTIESSLPNCSGTTMSSSPPPAAVRRDRSRTPPHRSPCRATPGSPGSPCSPDFSAGRTSGRRVLKRVCSDPPDPHTPSPQSSRLLLRNHSEEKQGASSRASHGCEQKASEDEGKVERLAPISVYDRKRHVDLMKVVGGEFSKVKCDHLPQGGLVDALIKAGFAKMEIECGLKQLDEENKILLIDDLVVMVG